VEYEKASPQFFFTSNKRDSFSSSGSIPWDRNDRFFGVGCNSRGFSVESNEQNFRASINNHFFPYKFEFK